MPRGCGQEGPSCAPATASADICNRCGHSQGEKAGSCSLRMRTKVSKFTSTRRKLFIELQSDRHQRTPRRVPRRRGVKAEAAASCQRETTFARGSDPMASGRLSPGLVLTGLRGGCFGLQRSFQRPHGGQGMSDGSAREARLNIMCTA